MIDTNTIARRAPTDGRRAEIAAAARALIVEKGVEGLRTRDIAERVGINIATLHYAAGPTITFTYLPLNQVQQLNIGVFD